LFGAEALPVTLPPRASRHAEPIARDAVFDYFRHHELGGTSHRWHWFLPDGHPYPLDKPLNPTGCFPSELEL
jgi:hypothetical protein